MGGLEPCLQRLWDAGRGGGLLLPQWYPPSSASKRELDPGPRTFRAFAQPQHGFGGSSKPTGLGNVCYSNGCLVALQWVGDGVVHTDAWEPAALPTITPAPVRQDCLIAA